VLYRIHGVSDEKKINTMQKKVRRDSVISVATGYGLDEFEFR
jgi:hypothetical protein